MLVMLVVPEACACAPLSQRLPPSLLGRFQLDACGVSVLAPAASAGAAATARAINAAAPAATPAVAPAHWTALDWDPRTDGSW